MRDMYAKQIIKRECPLAGSNNRPRHDPTANRESQEVLVTRSTTELSGLFRDCHATCVNIIMTYDVEAVLARKKKCPLAGSNNRPRHDPKADRNRGRY